MYGQIHQKYQMFSTRSVNWYIYFFGLIEFAMVIHSRGKEDGILIMSIGTHPSSYLEMDITSRSTNSAKPNACGMIAISSLNDHPTTCRRLTISLSLSELIVDLVLVVLLAVSVSICLFIKQYHWRHASTYKLNTYEWIKTTVVHPCSNHIIKWQLLNIRLLTWDICKQLQRLFICNKSSTTRGKFCKRQKQSTDITLRTQ